MTVETGTRLGPYQIVSPIGAGGMGEASRRFRQGALPRHGAPRPQSLADRVKKGPLPLDDVLKFGRQIASALAAAHRQGFTHRDLKPGNIMLTKSGAKLLSRAGRGVRGFPQLEARGPLARALA